MIELIFYFPRRLGGLICTFSFLPVLENIQVIEKKNRSAATDLIFYFVSFLLSFGIINNITLLKIISSLDTIIHRSSCFRSYIRTSKCIKHKRSGPVYFCCCCSRCIRFCCCFCFYCCCRCLHYCCC